MASTELEPIPEPGATASKDVSWFQKDVTAISEPARDLLESYSHLPSDQVLPHVLAIRDLAWTIKPYPCIGQLRFLDLSITLHPLYPRLLSLLSSSPLNQNLLLDLGCCFGQDVRALVAAGAPPSQIHGADLQKEFIDLGYELFQDKRTLNAKFIVGDIFNEADWKRQDGFGPLEGKLAAIHTASFFHLFDLITQKTLAKLLVRLLSPEPGSLIIGRQSGNENSGEIPSRTTPDKSCYRHNADSWRRMWDEVGRETGSEWTVDVWMERVEGWDGSGGREGSGWVKMTFGMERVS